MIPVQFITHYTDRYTYLDSARMALEGGCRWIQLRMKDATTDDIRPVALQVQALCKQHEALFVIDDHVELAKELEADGVHLGKNDMPVDEARRVLGEGCIIGGTANTFDDICRLHRAGADVQVDPDLHQQQRAEHGQRPAREKELAQLVPHRV